MSRYRALAVVVFLLGSAASGFGQAGPRPEDLQRGIQFVDDGDFEAAADVLEAVTVILEGRQSLLSELARAYLYLGIARLYTAGEAAARRAFYEAQQRNPRLDPGEANASRRVLRLWEEARTSAGDPPEPVVPLSPPAAIDPGSWLINGEGGLRFRLALAMTQTRCLGEMRVVHAEASLVWVPDESAGECRDGFRYALERVEAVNAATEGGFELRIGPRRVRRFVFIPAPYEEWFEGGTARLRHFDLPSEQRVATRLALRRLLAELDRSASATWLFYGAPVDASTAALFDTPAAFDGRSVRTRGRFELLRNGDARLYLLVSESGVINLIATPEQRALFHANARNLDGKEITVTGTFRRVTAPERRAMHRAMMNRRRLVEPFEPPTYAITFWDFASASLPPEHPPQRRLLDIITSVPIPLGQPLEVIGQFRGANRFADLPSDTERQDPRDWVIKDGPVSIWVRDLPPAGDGWALDLHSVPDTATWLRVRGRIVDDRGVFYLQASLVEPASPRPDALATSARHFDRTELPDVQFTLPIEVEPAPLDSQFVIQFTKAMDWRSFSGRVLMRYAGPSRANDQTFEYASFEYDHLLRALLVDPGVALQAGRDFEIVLQDGIHDVGGLPLAGRRTLKWTIAEGDDVLD